MTGGPASRTEDRSTEAPDAIADERLAAFLRREAARRTQRRRTDADVVDAIIGISAQRTRLRPAVALVIGAIVLTAVGGFVLGRSVGPFGSAAATPPATASPSPQPLGFPVVAAGEACPTSRRWLVGNDTFPAGAAIGGAPVFAFVADSGQPAYYEDARLGGWQRVDILWVAEPGFDRDFFVQAARLDAPGAVSFGDLTERVPVDRMQLDASWGTLDAQGWRVLGPLPMLLRGSGCYGLRIDTDRGSSISVFEVRPVVEAYVELEGRPLRLATIASGGACPVTPITSQMVFRGFLGDVAGEGPVYLARGAGLGMWVSDARELGPILIRGGRIDGPGELRFNVEQGPSRELRLPIHSYVYSPGQPPGWRQFISTIDPAPPGCYAVQIDTLTGTDWLVFAIGLD